MDHFDFAVVKSAFVMNESQLYEPLIAAGKPVWCVEYEEYSTVDVFTNTYCPMAKEKKFDLIYKDHDASALRRACSA